MHPISKSLAPAAALAVALIGAEALAKDSPQAPKSAPRVDSETPARDVSAEAPAAPDKTPAQAPSSAPPPLPTQDFSGPEVVAPAAPGSWFSLRPRAELGLLVMLSHETQLGRDGTAFDMKNDGGHGGVQPLVRVGLDLEIVKQHTITFLYQPLQLHTQVMLPHDLDADSARFTLGMPVRIEYASPLYRIGYACDVVRDEDIELSFGLSGQIRDTAIEIASLDGRQIRSRRDVSFLPLIRSRARYNFDSGMFIGAEIDGIYAPSRGTRANEHAEGGAFVDTSVRVGLRLPSHSEAFLNVRYLASGAIRQADATRSSDGYTSDQLQAVTFSIGADIATF